MISAKERALNQMALMHTWPSLPCECFFVPFYPRSLIVRAEDHEVRKGGKNPRLENTWLVMKTHLLFLGNYSVNCATGFDYTTNRWHD